MNADELLVALHERGIGIAPEGTAIRFAGPEGAMTEPLAAALSQHKALILAVWATRCKPSCDEAWETVREWLADGKPGPVPPAVIAAGKKIGLPYGERDYPPVYHDWLKMALRVRALLRVLNHEPSEQIPDTPDAA